MELYDNHIQIYISILQVLQSLSRDNHGIFISLVLFETWLCRVNNLQFFKAWPTRPHPVQFPNPPLFNLQTSVVDSQTQTEAIVLDIGPKTIFPLGQKQDLLPPRRSWEEPRSRPGRRRPAAPGKRFQAPLKNCSLSVHMFGLFPCCPVYKLT